MVRINLPQKRAITLLVIFFLGLYIGYFFGKTRQWQKISQEEKQTKAKSKINDDITRNDFKSVKSTDNLQANNLNYAQNLSEIRALNKNYSSISSKININTAGINELTKLPQIGEKIAQNIINYRKQNGPFKNIQELLKVKRIGPKTLAKIQDMIVVGDR